ncbi:cAMP-binding domain of CRP or a regulatory subunit of cAMP-dependent protein kinases [Reichenbachiella faecimaris]|uniref:cAMP-binding domain of CRP or a regulatory subunit of cAMP-dependent protein kinases n=1 Tax=Reichenbachiella faecimaris TaxID=692418 RepID=A0A1W2G5S0_REIFA|nr:response regulator [Reichenbachiella faecimaris]SMD31953.1 cAMP-binding domain of CRP or a regulatory subunit of cAMP-dependent protein kinases [Reichenbachiella faecimaris]
MNKILLIEDNVEVRENTAEILELSGYKVMVASNGKEGLDILKSIKPDLIICDIMMPVLDGYGVLHIVSKNPSTAHIPFIFLTAKVEKMDIRRGMNLGADDYLTKPFDDIELLGAVEARLKRTKQIQSEYDANISGLDSFFNDAKEIESLKELSKEKRIRHHKKKTNLYYEGDYPNYLIFINKGKIKTYKTNKDGKELITGLYGPGDFIGFNDLITQSDHSDSAMAIEDSESYYIPKDDFLQLIYKDRSVASRFIKILSGNLKDQEEKMLHIAYNSVRQRVAEALLTVQKNYGAEGKKFQFSREDLSNIVGTSPESVIRTLSDFKKEGLIEIKSNQITLLDMNELTIIISRGY